MIESSLNARGASSHDREGTGPTGEPCTHLPVVGRGRGLEDLVRASRADMLWGLGSLPAVLSKGKIK